MTPVASEVEARSAMVGSTGVSAGRVNDIVQVMFARGDNMRPFVEDPVACHARRYLVLPPEAVMEQDWLGNSTRHMTEDNRFAAVVLAIGGWLTVAAALDRTLIIAPPFEDRCDFCDNLDLCHRSRPCSRSAGPTCAAQRTGSRSARFALLEKL